MTSPNANFGCSFLSNPPDSIVTVEEFEPDERMMVDTAEQFARGEILPVVDRLEAKEEGLMPSLIEKAGTLGLCGVDAPEKYGGLGLGKNLAARILEFMSQVGSFSVTYGVTTGIAQVGLSLFGTEEQKAKYLPHLTSGRWLGAYALSEPDSGSDALSISTSADRSSDHFVLNGTKMWISNAKWAELFVVMAKVDGERFSALLVERGVPGVSIGREEHKLGLRGSSTARLVLDNAKVPAKNLLYEEGKGHLVAFNALNLGRFKLSAMSLGSARETIGLAARYAQERRQFGAAIASFGLIQKKLASMAAMFFVVESMLYRTGALIDEAFASGGETLEGNRCAAEEYAVECSMCKVFATEVQAYIVDEALQCFGGYGFTEEFPVARHYRDARVSRIYEGTNEINRLFISDRYFRRIKEGRASSSAAEDSFISGLTAKALALRPEGQIATAGLSDLMILTYAEQSARLRAQQVGGMGFDLYDAALSTLNVKAAEAFQTATGCPVALPAVRISATEAIATEVGRQGVLRF